LKHGQGKTTWLNGDVLESEYRDGEKIGKSKGRLIMMDTIYDGELSQRRKPEGQGSLIPAREDATNRLYMEGEWKDGRMVEGMKT
jgi:hypothetical protein